MPTFKQNREEYEEKAGGKPAIIPLRKGRVEGGRCVCQQESPTRRYKVYSNFTKNTHLVGSCCIDYYLTTNVFGGKYGWKQGSYKQMLEGYKLVVEKNGTEKDKYLLNVLIPRIRTGGNYLYVDEIAQIEETMGGKINPSWTRHERPIERIKHVESPEEEQKRREYWGIKL